MDQKCAELISQLREIVEAKAAGADRSELKPMLSKTALNLVKIRQSAKQQVEGVEGFKASTARSKADVETSNLQLQNLLYEKNYYTKEILTCRSFQSKYTEKQIGLVPLEQFLEEAPDSYKEGIDDEHTLQKQRLKYEKHQRLGLLKDLEAVRQRKGEQSQSVATKRKHLADVQSQLVSLKKAALGVRGLLGINATPLDERQKVLAHTLLLPVPLYVLYHQLKAVKEAHAESITVTITGSQKDAEALAHSSGADVFESVDKDGDPARKRRKTDKGPVSEPAYRVHPLSVVLEAQQASKEAVQLRFFYLSRLECVTVKAGLPSHQQLLGTLFPGDTGAELPNELPQQLSSSGTFEYDASRSDRPYLWAQHLAGMDFLPALTQTGSLLNPSGRESIKAGMASYRKQHRVQSVLKKLQAAASLAQTNTSRASVATVPVEEGTPVKRIRTWEEIVQERSRPVTPVAPADKATAISPQKGDAALNPPAAGNESDEEEGQLPQDT